MHTNLSLWQRLRHFDLDGVGVEFPFSARLGRENGWSLQQTLGAIEEYKKFVYLLCVSDLPLTPSEDVDQVWHLHLVYTRSYWTKFCDGVLGRRIHHEPTKGGMAQAELFEDQYARTCALYEREFGATPPAEFWPLPSERFAAAPRQQWIDRRRHWIVPKPRGLGRILKRIAAVPFALLATSGALQAEGQPEASSNVYLAQIIGFAIFIAVGLWVGLDRRQNEKTEDDKNRGGWWWSGCSGCGGCGGCGG